MPKESASVSIDPIFVRAFAASARIPGFSVRLMCSRTALDKEAIFARERADIRHGAKSDKFKEVFRSRQSHIFVQCLDKLKGHAYARQFAKRVA